MTIDLQRLLTWLSPAFPVGAFAWSAGLETAIADGVVHDRVSTHDWIEGTLVAGGAKTDAILLAQAHCHHDDLATLRDLTDLSLALIPARERLDETLITGQSFGKAVAAWQETALPDPCPYPIAIGAVAGAHGLDRTQTLAAFLTAVVHGQVSVAVRLVPIGQSDGLAIMAALEPLIADLAQSTTAAGLDHIGGIPYAADIAQMRHETLPTRIFRS